MGAAAEMSPKSCLGVARAFLFLFNLLCFTAGTLLLAFGLWILFDPRSIASLLGSPLYTLRGCSYVFSGVGVGTMVLGFLGGLGALKEVKALLLLYFGVLLLLFAAQITGGVIVYTQRGTLWAAVAARAQELIGGYPPHGPPTPPQETWDALQQQLRCCGWNGPQDWGEAGAPPGAPPAAIACSCLLAPPPGNGTPGPPPPLPHGRCPTAAPQDVFPMGCAGGARGWLAQNLVAIVGGALGIGLMELCLLMVAMFLIRNVRPPRERLRGGL